MKGLQGNWPALSEQDQGQGKKTQIGKSLKRHNNQMQRMKPDWIQDVFRKTIKGVMEESDLA